MTRPTRRSVLTGIAGATIATAAVASLHALAKSPRTEHLTPDEREVLDLYRRTPGSVDRPHSGRATSIRVMKVFADNVGGEWS